MTAQPTISYEVLSGAGGEYALGGELAENHLIVRANSRVIVLATPGANGKVNRGQLLEVIDKVKRKSGIEPSHRAVPLSTLKQMRDEYDLAKSTSAMASSVSQEEVIRVFTDAVKDGGSDIHIRVTDSTVSTVHLRIDGDLYKKAELPSQRAKDFCATIYQSMCDVADEMYRPNAAQDARLKAAYVRQLGLFGARIATRPTPGGTLMVLRLLYDTGNKMLTLEDCGYNASQIADIERMKNRVNGINIMSGATGSGKSTTLVSVLTDFLKNPEHQHKHVLTIEDPPEYTIAGSVQTELEKGHDADDTRAWARAISNAVRLDPDVLLVGEVRDFESATAALRAAMTGHLVWTTAHTNDAVGVLERLRDLNVDIGMLTDPALITGLINQSLVGLVCPHCCQGFNEVRTRLSKNILARLEKHCTDYGKLRFRGQGCEHCKHRGIKGRTVVAEVITPTAELMQVFRRESKVEARRFWLHEMDGYSKARHMVDKINRGLLDPVMAEASVCSMDEDKLTIGVV